MAMLKTNMEISEGDGSKCLDENLTGLPCERVDIKGLYQRRPPCKQIEKSLEDIEAMVLQGDQETIAIFPRSFPGEEAYVNLKTRLSELSTMGNVGLAYIAKSLPVTANMDMKYKTPGEVIMDVCLIRQRSPAVMFSVVTDMSENMKLQTQRYNSAVSKEVTKNVRKFTIVTFNCLYGLVNTKDLMSKESFKSSLASIEEERSRLCIPDSLTMDNQKYKHVVRAFLSSVAATEFVSGEDDETLWFLSHKQFCILTENIDHTEVHVDTFPASGGRVLSLTVSQRLQKLGRTLLISDDDKLIKYARIHNIDCKTFSDLGQSHLGAEGKGFLYVVVYEDAEPSLSQVPHLPQLLAAAQKRWIFHRQKGSIEDEDVQYLTQTKSNPSATTPVYGKGSGFLEREIRMVLVGKTGVGKSATGNTICGAGKGTQIFKALARAMSVTKKCKQHSFKRFGYDLQLVDVPGFCDTSKSDEDIMNEVMKCVGMSSPGIHAILFIVRIGRFTEEDKNTLERFLQCFGQAAKRFVIVVFTGKDDLEEADDTLDNYLGDIPMRLKQFLLDASLRFIAVNNRGTNEEKENFTKDLIDKVRSMVDKNGGHGYTNEMYERCEADLQEAERKEKLEEKRQNLLQEKLKQEAAAVEEQRLKMQEVEKQLEKLQTKIKLKEEQWKYLEEEVKRHAKQVEALEKKRSDFMSMMHLEMKQIEKVEKELHLEQARKQIREKFEDEDPNFVHRLLQWRIDYDFVLAQL
ncbi:uncharacterized protein [Haliotis asinina]